MTAPCASGLTCQAGTQTCVGPRQAGQGCHATAPCAGGLTCEAGTQTCVGSRQEGEACHLTAPCAGGLTCEAGSQTCVGPRQVGQGCHSTAPCASGLSCQPIVHKCSHSPRRYGEPCSAGYGCGDLNCVPIIQMCANKAAGLGEICGGGSPCAMWSPRDAESVKLNAYCEPITQVCKRTNPCKYTNGFEASIDNQRIAFEDQAVALAIEAKLLKVRLLTVASLASTVQAQGARPVGGTADLGAMIRLPFRQAAWDTNVAAFRRANKTSAADLQRLNKIGPDLNALRGTIQTWVELQKSTPCGQILSAANSVMDALMAAAAAVEKWAEENKCILIKVAFAAAGTLGDITLVAGLAATGAGAPLAANLAAMQVQPIDGVQDHPGVQRQNGGPRRGLRGSGRRLHLRPGHRPILLRIGGRLALHARLRRLRVRGRLPQRVLPRWQGLAAARQH